MFNQMLKQIQADKEVYSTSKYLSPLPFNVLEKTNKTISDYNLLIPGQTVGVAFSGGKDSLFTMLVLRELGYVVVPVIVDMGYEKDWGEKIVKLAEAVGFANAEVLTARDSQVQRSLAEQAFAKVKSNIETLNDPSIFLTKNVTPCTFCYNTKAILLENFAIKNNIDSIVFGQHAIDGIVSMLKAAFMYIDRWDNNNETFSHPRFSSLVDEILPVFMQPPSEVFKSSIYKRIEQLCAERLAATDDPPHQKLNASSGNIKLVRPLYRIYESVIIQYVQENNLKTEGSGCGHGATKETQTPREMIHYRILKLMDKSEDGHVVLDHLLKLTENGLSESGQLVANVRNSRDKLLGEKYKSLGKCEQNQKV